MGKEKEKGKDNYKKQKEPKESKKVDIESRPKNEVRRESEYPDPYADTESKIMN